MWFGDLIDIKQFPAGVGGQDLYIRLDASELGKALIYLLILPP